MPTGRDAELVSSALQTARIPTTVCDSAKAVKQCLAGDAGALLVAEEALRSGRFSDLVKVLEDQPVWSDLQVIVFSSSGPSAEILLRDLGSKVNVVVVERPIRVTMLISAVRGALRARMRQYETRDLLKQLKEADDQKDLFLATLSHELRTPLNSILGWIQIMRTGNTEVDREHALDVIERNARSQSEMISDILFVSRVITGKIELDRKPLRVSEIVRNVIDVVNPTAAAKNISIEFENRKDKVYIDADNERLEQIFLNLLSNALKFTPKGGRIDVIVERKGSDIEIEVRDNGQGIDPDFLPFIFERFRQADNTYTRRSGGLGLGLAIVRHLVELHGGSIRAESTGKGRGSSFFVSLPVTLSDELSKRPHLPAAAVGRNGHSDVLKGIRVLLVEDDGDSRDMLRTILSHHGARVETAETAGQAMQELIKKRPEILISDVGLPVEDGYDLIRKVRSLPAKDGGAIPAIALTGYVSQQDRLAAIDAGFQEHFSKPVDLEALIDQIARLTSPQAAASPETSANNSY